MSRSHVNVNVNVNVSAPEEEALAAVAKGGAPLIASSQGNNLLGYVHVYEQVHVSR